MVNLICGGEEVEFDLQFMISNFLICRFKLIMGFLWRRHEMGRKGFVVAFVGGVRQWWLIEVSTVVRSCVLRLCIWFGWLVIEVLGVWCAI